MLETLATNIVLGGIGIAAGILGARLLGPAGKGELATLQIVASLIVVVVTLGLFDAVIYYAAGNAREGVCDSVAATAFLLAFGVVVLPVASLLVPVILPDARPGVVLGARAYLAIFPAFILLGTVQSLLRARMDMRQWNLIRLGSQGLWLIVLVGGWILAVRFPERLAIAYVIALNLLALGVALAFWRLWRPGWPPDLSRVPRLLRYGLPIAMRAGPQQLTVRLDVLVIAVVLPPREVGIYTAAASWSMMLMPLPQAIASVLFPRLSGEKDGVRRGRLEVQAVLVSSAVVVLGAAALALATPMGFPLLFGRDFRGGVPYALGLILAGAVLAVTRVLGVVVQSRGRTAPLLWAEMAGLGVTVLGLVVLVPTIGVWGAVVTSIVAYGVVAAVLGRAWLRARAGGLSAAP
jgi:O-antigen/teichoic acid export membrane protein